MQSHLEPLAEPAAGRAADDGSGRDRASCPRRDRNICLGPSASSTPTKGLIVFLTLVLDPAASLGLGPCDGLRHRAERSGRRCPGRRGDRPHGTVTAASRSIARCASACSTRTTLRWSAAGSAGSTVTACCISRPRLCSRLPRRRSAREHAEYALADVTLLVPVQYPPTMRVFDSRATFAFATRPPWIRPGSRFPARVEPHTLYPRLACVIGAEGRIRGYALFAESRSLSSITAQGQGLRPRSRARRRHSRRTRSGCRADHGGHRPERTLTSGAASLRLGVSAELGPAREQRCERATCLRVPALRPSLPPPARSSSTSRGSAS